MTRILLWSPLDDYLVDTLASFEAIEFLRIGNVAELIQNLPNADAMVLLGTLYGGEVAKAVHEQSGRLRWIQLTTAGYDGISFHGVPSSVVVTNAGHIHAPLIAEHAMSLLLALVRRLPCYGECQVRRTWDRKIPLPLTTLEDSHVVVLGYGGIGKEIARRLKAFGSRVTVVARFQRHDDVADRIVASARFHEVLSEADALIIAAALTPETKGMVDARALASLPRGSLLVNIARCGVLDSMAVVDALSNGHLFGAGLDVTDPEPLPSDHPLWKCPNLIVTPHVAAFGSAAVRRRFGALLKENVLRFQQGMTLQHIVA
jgi:phosphoglycerate dehydrogenase-like enzyme